MHDGFTLNQAIEDSLDHVEQCIEEMHQLSEKKAAARRDYRIAKAAQIIAERAAGTPATITQDIVNGKTDVADKKFALECAEGEYDANYQAVLYWKKRADTYREQLDREWSRAGENR